METGGSTRQQAAGRAITVRMRTENPPLTSAVRPSKDRRERRLRSSSIPRGEKDMATQIPTLKGLCRLFHIVPVYVVTRFSSWLNFSLGLPLCSALLRCCGSSRGNGTNKSWSSSSSKGGSKASGWGSRGSAGDAPAGRGPGILSVPDPQTNQRPFLKPAYSHM